ncbi:hypothetical protein [Sphingomonas hankookensis]|uniref:hypothetical protein n=1 Tax=Sphingomonas hankookensis TaxID=563996 RepID=UPI003D301E09
MAPLPAAGDIGQPLLAGRALDLDRRHLDRPVDGADLDLADLDVELGRLSPSTLTCGSAACCVWSILMKLNAIRPATIRTTIPSNPRNARIYLLPSCHDPNRCRNNAAMVARVAAGP